MNMRRTRCLVHGKIRDCVIVNGKRKIIEVDPKYGEFFYVDNEKITGSALDRKFKSFSGRVKDAVETIREGNGDVLKVGAFGGEDVIYFLDRTVGDELRKKFIEGWADTKFGWQLVFENRNSMFGGRPLNIDNEVSFLDGKPLMYFNTEEDATEYKDKLLKTAYKNAKDMVDGMKQTPGDEDELGQWLDDMEARHGKHSIVNDMVFDMVVGDAVSLKFDEPKLDTYVLKTKQCVIKE